MNKYLLPCECGKKIPVEAGQSGTALACECGRRVEVPTMRELSRMKAAPDERSQDEKPLWGWRQSLAFLGLVIVVGAAACGTYLNFNRSRAVDYESMRRDAADLDIKNAWGFWRAFRDFGIELNVPRQVAERDPEKNPFFDPSLLGAANTLKYSLLKIQHDLDGDNEILHWIYIAGGIAVIGGVLMAVSYFWPAGSHVPVKKHRARPRSA